MKLFITLGYLAVSLITAHAANGPGFTHDEMTRIQTLLAERGYYDPKKIDGIPGPNTAAAIQKAFGLEPVRVFGPKTTIFAQKLLKEGVWILPGSTAGGASVPQPVKENAIRAVEPDVVSVEKVVATNDSLLKVGPMKNAPQEQRPSLIKAKQLAASGADPVLSRYVSIAEGLEEAYDKYGAPLFETGPGLSRAMKDAVKQAVLELQQAAAEFSEKEGISGLRLAGGQAESRFVFQLQKGGPAITFEMIEINSVKTVILTVFKNAVQKNVLMSGLSEEGMREIENLRGTIIRSSSDSDSKIKQLMKDPEFQGKIINLFVRQRLDQFNLAVPGISNPDQIHGTYLLVWWPGQYILERVMSAVYLASIFYQAPEEFSGQYKLYNALDLEIYTPLQSAKNAVRKGSPQWNYAAAQSQKALNKMAGYEADLRSGRYRNLRYAGAMISGAKAAALRHDQQLALNQVPQDPRPKPEEVRMLSALRQGQSASGVFAADTTKRTGEALRKSSVPASPRSDKGAMLGLSGASAQPVRSPVKISPKSQAPAGILNPSAATRTGKPSRSEVRAGDRERVKNVSSLIALEIRRTIESLTAANTDFSDLEMVYWDNFKTLADQKDLEVAINEVMADIAFLSGVEAVENAWRAGLKNQIIDSLGPLMVFAKDRILDYFVPYLMNDELSWMRPMLGQLYQNSPDFFSDLVFAIVDANLSPREWVGAAETILHRPRYSDRESKIKSILSEFLLRPSEEEEAEFRDQKIARTLGAVQSMLPGLKRQMSMPANRSPADSARDAFWAERLDPELWRNEERVNSRLRDLFLLINFPAAVHDLEDALKKYQDSRDTEYWDLKIGKCLYLQSFPQDLAALELVLREQDPGVIQKTAVFLKRLAARDQDSPEDRAMTRINALKFKGQWSSSYGITLFLMDFVRGKEVGDLVKTADLDKTEFIKWITKAKDDFYLSHGQDFDPLFSARSEMRSGLAVLGISASPLEGAVSQEVLMDERVLKFLKGEETASADVEAVIERLAAVMPSPELSLELGRLGFRVREVDLYEKLNPAQRRLLTDMIGVRLKNNGVFADPVRDAFRDLGYYGRANLKLNSPVDGTRLPNYFAILGIPRGAKRSILETSFRELHAAYHPVWFFSAEEKVRKDRAEYFELLLEAYEVLTDPDRTMDYVVQIPRTGAYPEKVWYELWNGQGQAAGTASENGRFRSASKYRVNVRSELRELSQSILRYLAPKGAQVERPADLQDEVEQVLGLGIQAVDLIEAIQKAAEEIESLYPKFNQNESLDRQVLAPLLASWKSVLPAGTADRKFTLLLKLSSDAASNADLIKAVLEQKASIERLLIVSEDGRIASDLTASLKQSRMIYTALKNLNQAGKIQLLEQSQLPVLSKGEVPSETASQNRLLPVTVQQGELHAQDALIELLEAVLQTVMAVYLADHLRGKDLTQLAEVQEIEAELLRKLRLDSKVVEFRHENGRVEVVIIRSQLREFLLNYQRAQAVNQAA